MEILHGRVVPDPYRWLENPATGQTRRWSIRQASHTAAQLSQLPKRAWFAERLAQLMKTDVDSVPVLRGRRSFFLGLRRGHDVPVLLVSDDTERILLDPAMLDPTGGGVLDGWHPSPSGRLLAYQVSRGGTEQGMLQVIDVESGASIGGPIPRTRYSSVAWLADESGFYYVRPLPPGARSSGPGQLSRRVWLHRLGTDPDSDVLVFGENAGPTAAHRVSLDQGRWLIVKTTSGTSPHNDVHLADLTDSPPDRPSFRAVQSGLDASTTAMVCHDGRLYLRTTHLAPLGRVCVADPADPGPDRWRELIPQAGDAVLANCGLLKTDEPERDLLLVVRNRHAVSEASVHDAASGRQLYPLHFPGLGTARRMYADPDGGPSAWFSYTDHATPPTVLRYDARSHILTRTASAETRAAATASVVHATYRSPDGTTVRLFVVAPAECAEGPDRPRPAILTGYGGFGVSMVPSYEAEALSWVEAGGVFVIACIRGGGEEGAAWHRAGMRQNRHNTFDDFHAAARWLVTSGWTTSAQLGIVGASNGGLLVAAALTQRPELYAAAVCIAPLTDMSRYELFGRGPTWRHEYGSRDNPAELDWLLSYSPYHRITKGIAYPATLLVAYEADTRVDPLHSRKFCAALQYATGGKAPILFHGIPDAGHGTRPLGQATAVAADTLAFLGQHTGLSAPASHRCVR